MNKNRKNPKVRYTQTLGVRLDGSTRSEIDIVAFFHRKKPGTWARDLIVEEVQKHLNRPDYLRFKKELKRVKKGGRLEWEHH
ncbi:MAG: hypothetical protein ACE5L6_02080 [Candidatus Bathyarchaeia archaeon]